MECHCCGSTLALELLIEGEGGEVPRYRICPLCLHVSRPGCQRCGYSPREDPLLLYPIPHVIVDLGTDCLGVLYHKYSGYLLYLIFTRDEVFHYFTKVLGRVLADFVEQEISDILLVSGTQLYQVLRSSVPREVLQRHLGHCQDLRIRHFVSGSEVISQLWCEYCREVLAEVRFTAVREDYTVHYIR